MPASDAMAAGPPIIPAIPRGPENMSHATEKLEVCPYNPAHTILRYRMQNHLFKCRKNHISDDYATCTFNSTHHVPSLELEFHENRMCPDRHSFQANQFAFETEAKIYAPVVHIDLPEPEEDWDDGQVNSFDPAQNAAEKSLIRGVHGVQPAERKAFKLQHRKHVQEREEEENAKGPIKPKPKKEEKHQDAPVEQLQPLRTPKEFPKGFSFGRGMKMPNNEKVKSPGEMPSVSTLSLKSEKENVAVPDVIPQGIRSSQKVVLTGHGRGHAVGAPSPISTPGSAGTVQPHTSAWGRGRPKF